MSTHTQEIDYDACDVGDGGFFDVYRTTTRTAAKLHRCYECDGVILPGDRYEVATMLYEGWWDTCRSCLACVEGPMAFVRRNCGGVLHGGVVDHLAVLHSEYGFRAGVRFRVGRWLVEARRRGDAARRDALAALERGE